MSEPIDDLIGKTLQDQYTIIEEIGRGGMATVYSAKQQSMNRIVAVKVLPRSLLHDPGFLERFEREVEVISGLEHPHILPIYDYGESEGVPFITMRYLGGGSMAQMVRRGVPTLKDLERPLSQMAQALDYAHQQGIIHRDLKPGNIMLDESGNAYLSDFGIARVMGSELTGSAIIGTPAYMSPEQANGFAIDARSDIYALGVVLFELITGREPYQAETPMALLLKHINEPMPAVRDFREGVPFMVEDVIVKSTEKDPDNRYASAGELAQAFNEALRTADEIRSPSPTKSASTQASPQAPTDVAPSIPLAPEVLSPTGELLPGDMTQPQAPSKSSRNMLPIALAVIAIIIVGGGLVLFASNQGSDTPEPVAVVPTPFRRATTVESSDYSISIPEAWMPLGNDFINRSDSKRSFHVWQTDDTVRVSVAIVDKGITPRSDYASEYYEDDDDLSLIDEATAPNGTIRNSYRVLGDYDDLPAGQLDVFYTEQDATLAVIEVYTADGVATDRTILNTMQLILDSFRIASS